MGAGQHLLSAVGKWSPKLLVQVLNLCVAYNNWPLSDAWRQSRKGIYNHRENQGTLREKNRNGGNQHGDFAQRIQKEKMKVHMQSSVHKNLRCNNLQFTLECQFNVQHCILQKYLTNYNLWNKNVQYIALKELMKSTRKLKKKVSNWMLYPQLVHAL